MVGWEDRTPNSWERRENEAFSMPEPSGGKCTFPKPPSTKAVCFEEE